MTDLQTWSGNSHRTGRGSHAAQQASQLSLKRHAPCDRTAGGQLCLKGILHSAAPSWHPAVRIVLRHIAATSTVLVPCRDQTRVEGPSETG